MATGDDIPKRLSEIYIRIDELKTRASKDPGRIEEILSSAFEELEVSLEELSTTDEELCQQNAELTLLASFPQLNPNPIVEVDQEGQVHFLNPAAKRLFPELQESGGSHLWLADWEAVVQNFSDETRTHTRDISVGARWYQQAMYLVPGTRRIRIYGMDITERKQIDEALHQSEQLYKTLAETSPALVWLARVDGTAEYVDPSWREYTGLTLEQINKIGWTQLDHPDDRARLRAAWADCYERGKSFKAEFRYRRHDGLYRWFLGRATPLKDKEGRIIKWVGVMTDISEHKQLEQELEQRVQERTSELQGAKKELEIANEELYVELEQHQKLEADLIKAKDAAEEAAEAKAAFLANMSHEIRTPMNAVIGFTSLLLEEPLTPDQKDYIEGIRNGGEALLGLINDILDFSRADKEKVVLEHQPFNLRSCIESSLDIVASQANQKGLNLSYTISYGTPGAIIGDPGRLRQVLVNLLGNSVKFTDEGEVSIIVSDQAGEGDKQKFYFSVKDTGIGIQPDKLDKIFEPFTQVERVISRKRDGVGLGLAISKKLVELMGGRIWAESVSGQGSTFHFTIQAEAIPGRHLDLGEANKGNAFKNLAVQNPLSILVAEDNPSNQRVLVTMLKRMGYRPDAVSDGKEVLQALELRPYDLILMDVRMPEMDGITATQVIRKLQPEKGPKIIAITAYALEGDREKCLEAGMDGYIAKPVLTGELVEVLKRCSQKAQ